jgi:hypothetical protein
MPPATCRSHPRSRVRTRRRHRLSRRCTVHTMRVRPKRFPSSLAFRVRRLGRVVGGVGGGPCPRNCIESASAQPALEHSLECSHTPRCDRGEDESAEPNRNGGYAEHARLGLGTALGGALTGRCDVGVAAGEHKRAWDDAWPGRSKSTPHPCRQLSHYRDVATNTPQPTTHRIGGCARSSTAAASDGIGLCDR